MSEFIRLTNDIDTCPICKSGKPILLAPGSYQCPRCSYGSGICGYAAFHDLVLDVEEVVEGKCIFCKKPSLKCAVTWTMWTYDPMHCTVFRDTVRPDGSGFCEYISMGWCCSECGLIETGERTPWRRVLLDETEEHPEWVPKLKAKKFVAPYGIEPSAFPTECDPEPLA